MLGVYLDRVKMVVERTQLRMYMYFKFGFAKEFGLVGQTLIRVGDREVDYTDYSRPVRWIPNFCQHKS